MRKCFIENVPKYFEPHVNDCFQNAISAQLLFQNQNPDLILADYLSFMYDEEENHIGINYLFKPNTSVEFTEEELNTSLEMAYFPAPCKLNGTDIGQKVKHFKDRINVEMYLTDDTDFAYCRLKELINNGIPAVVAVDLYHMQYHRAYKKEHGLHYVVITGYDEDEGIFELFDKYKLSSSDFEGRLPMDEICLARNSENPLNNAIMGEYTRPIRNIWCEFRIDNEFKVTEEKIINVIEESCKRMIGKTRVLGKECGFRPLEKLIYDLSQKKDEGIDEHNQYLYKTYYNESFKTIARSRKRFKVFISKLEEYFPNMVPTEISGFIDEASKHWDICANLSLKLGITKSLSLLKDIDKQLNNVKDKESYAVEMLNGFVDRFSK